MGQSIATRSKAFLYNAFHAICASQDDLPSWLSADVELVAAGARRLAGALPDAADCIETVRRDRNHAAWSHGQVIGSNHRDYIDVRHSKAAVRVRAMTLIDDQAAAQPTRGRQPTFAPN